MARFAFRLPDIGEGIAEAEIVAWHVKIGDYVKEGSPLADMMTDKATVEMEAPVTGSVVELAGAVGDQVPIGAALVIFEVDAGAEEEHPSTEQVRAAAPGEEAGLSLDDDPLRTPVTARAASDVGADTTRNEAPGRQILASPAVRARARDLGVDFALVRHEGGRIRHADLDAYLRYEAGQGYHTPHGSHARADQAIRLVGLRRRIADNMAASKRNIPHFTYVEEMDVTALETMRGDLNAGRGARPRLTLLPLLITAICRAIPDFPMINARFDDETGIVTHYGRVHLGVATHVDAGLMVPVIRDAQDRNLWQLAAEISRLADAARNGRAKSEELSGSTLTVTSLGPLGGIATGPVINRPEVAIIGPNRIVERPVFRGDDIVRAKLMNLSISCDHRVVDGWDAANFVHALKKLLETPVLLFAQ